MDTDQPGLVYMLTHRPTRKSYIGKTMLGGLDERIRLHITSARSGQNDNGTLHYYLRTDGIESFDVKVLEEYTPTARATQRRYIQKFDTFNTGLNRTKGGHRGGSGRRILFKGAWYEGFSDLVEKNLGKDAIALISRGYSLLRDHAKSKEAAPSDELIERALALIAAEVPPSVLSLYRPLPLSYAGQQYGCLAELVSEQVPSTPLDKMVPLMRCVEKALPDAALHEVEAIIDKGLDAVLDPWRTLRQVEKGLACEGAAFDVHKGNLGRRIRRLLDQKPLNLSFQRELKALLGGYLTREGRLRAPHHWRAQLKAWESHKKSPSFESADWATYVMLDYLASLDTKDTPSLQWALGVRYRLREICGTHLTKKLRAQVMSPKVSLPRVHPKIKKEFFLRAARERVHGRSSAYFFEGAQMHLRLAQFPLPRSFGEQDLAARNLVQICSVPEAFQLPLRTTLKLLTLRRRAGWLPTIDQERILENRRVQWCAGRKKYRYFDAGYETARMLSREAEQERQLSRGEPDWLSA
ncbi:hypothetical protein LC612_42360 [Nostoc sp. CHAB 5834]|nr:hypothetical protein [Nostoc sp. CHAB 5834]